MKYQQIQIMNEKKIRIYGIIIQTIYLELLFYIKYIHDLKSALQTITISIFYSYIIWDIARWIALRTAKKLPGIENSRKRTLLLLKQVAVFSIITGFAEEAFGLIIGLYQNIWPLAFWYTFFGVLFNILLLSIVIGFYEGLSYIENWKKLFAESERLKKINVTSQYQFLRDQVKPHFLFNSLNTLTSLIASDRNKAEQFVCEMSTVYRYLLTKKEKELSTLQEELNFLNSYVTMLKTRFDDSLQISIKIDPVYYHHLLPPFVLQILVENAVKHNIVSRERPLEVQITSDNQDNLIITNNIQPKPIPEPSEKTGLSNLITRYRLLDKEDDLLITDEGNVFKIVLPLLQSSRYSQVATVE